MALDCFAAMRLAMTRQKGRFEARRFVFLAQTVGLRAVFRLSERVWVPACAGSAVVEGLSAGFSSFGGPKLTLSIISSSNQ